GPVVVEDVRHDDRGASEGRRADPEGGHFCRDRGGAASSEQADERVEPRRAGEGRVGRAKLAPQPVTCSEEQRLHRRAGDGEGGSELVVGEAAELAQEQRVSLLSRERLDRVPERGEVSTPNRLGERV